jgi:hypothetical protein
MAGRLIRTKNLVRSVKELAEARSKLAIIKKSRADLQADIDALIEEKFGSKTRSLDASIDAAKVEAERLDGQVRTLAVKSFEKDGNQKPHPAVGIGEYTVLEYDTDKALDYARKHIPNAVKLDKTAFKKAAKVLGLEFVEVSVEPRAKINRDLTEYL